MTITPLTVFLAALVTAVATGLGAAPFLFARTMSRQGLGLSNALAAGLMLAASLMLFYEGQRDSLVLVPRGMRVWKAGLWSIFSSLPQPLMAVPAFLFVEAFAPLLPAGLGFAAGAMIWMSIRDLVPDALHDAPPRFVYSMMLTAMAAMLVFQYVLKMQ